MNLLSKACLVLLSSNASVAFGSTGSEKEHGREQSSRNLGLRGGEMIGEDASDEIMDNRISNLFEKVDDEMYDLLAVLYNQLSDEISSTLLEENPDLDEEGLAHAREAFLGFLQDDNDVPDDTNYDPEDEAEDEDIFDSLEEVIEESNADGSMKRTRGGWAHTSYHKRGNKGCRNYKGKKGRSGKDYDLYKHVSKSYCESKCNGSGYCYGYEYSSYDSKCEIWKVLI
eukprot:888386_1